MNSIENWKNITEKLKSTKRKGVNNLIDYLKTTDFVTAPASSKYHLNIEGGLMQHSLNVLRFSEDINRNTKLNLPEASLILCSLLHDLCKVNYYVMGEEWDKEYKDKYNQWRKKSVWKIVDQFPVGHGEKSVMMALPYVDLQDDEIAGIRWHMLKWDCGEANYRNMQEAMNRYKIVKVIAIADQYAELYETANET